MATLGTPAHSAADAAPQAASRAAASPQLAPLHDPATPRPGGGAVADTCLELLCHEAVRMYTRLGAKGGPSAAAALHAVGTRVGAQMAERTAQDAPRLADTLDAIKFVCKDFWAAVFRKQVDNLRTNHRGVFVLSDNNFSWLARLPPLSGADDDAARAAALLHVQMAAGILCGALSQLGVACTVEPSVRAGRACVFTVNVSTQM